MLDSVHEIVPQLTLAVARYGQDIIPFQEIHFDLIFLIDVIYYLSDNEIVNFYSDVVRRLSSGGLLILQFIEADWRGPEITILNDGLELRSAKRESFAEGNNPIRYINAKAIEEMALDVGLAVVGRKVQIEPYDSASRDIRCRRFVAFEFN